MEKGAPNLKLRAWRSERGYTMEEAAALVVVDGVPCTKATWHGWESAGKIPKRPWMLPLCALTGLQPNDFYPRFDGSKSGNGNGGRRNRDRSPLPKPGNDEPPQMALAI